MCFFVLRLILNVSGDELPCSGGGGVVGGPWTNLKLKIFNWNKVFKKKNNFCVCIPKTEQLFNRTINTEVSQCLISVQFELFSSEC